MRRIMYFSAARPLPEPGQLDRLLAVSRRNNARDGITGMLMYHDGGYLQILEGEAEMIEACYGRIGGDPSHRHLLKIMDAEVEERLFGEWSMGFARPEDLDRDGGPELRALKQVIADLPRIKLVDPRAATLIRAFFKTLPEYAHKVA